ncbi:hypothetical protein VTH06DRAFT_4263 [Thermothelomyces fergusii]
METCTQSHLLLPSYLFPRHDDVRLHSTQDGKSTTLGRLAERLKLGSPWRSGIKECGTGRLGGSTENEERDGPGELRQALGSKQVPTCTRTEEGFSYDFLLARTVLLLDLPWLLPWLL